MMNGGPVLEYFKALVSSENNTLAFVGYQADGTLGRRIQNGASSVTLSENGKSTKFDIKMNVENAEGFSGHSTKNS